MGLIPYEYLIFDGRASAEFGVWISGSGTFNAPARDMDTVSVPGRNGNLIFDNGRFNNITVSYPAFISRKFQPRIDDFRAWICSKYRYCRLEDTYHPDEFRMGVYKGGLNVSAAARNIAGRFTLSFDCKPQRFLKIGAIPVKFVASDNIWNPTHYVALPLVRCYGAAGVVTINGVSVAVTGCSDYVDIDCDIMEAYEGNDSRNGTTTLQNGEFPTLSPGNNTVSFTGFSSVVVTPRYFTI